MKTTRRYWIGALWSGLFLAVLFSSATARANAVEDGATAFVLGLSQRAITELTENDVTGDERERRFRVLLNDHFDVPAIAKWVLGRYWRKVTPDQKSDYLNLFEDLIVRTYLGRFDQYAGEKLSIIKAKADDGKSVTVYSRIESKDQSKKIQIDWRISIHDDLFRIVDVVVEGVSMSQTQRSEFASVIRQGGGKVEGLLVELRKKVGRAP